MCNCECCNRLRAFYQGKLNRLASAAQQIEIDMRELGLSADCAPQLVANSPIRSTPAPGDPFQLTDGRVDGRSARRVDRRSAVIDLLKSGAKSLSEIGRLLGKSIGAFRRVLDDESTFACDESVYPNLYSLKEAIPLPKPMAATTVS